MTAALAIAYIFSLTVVLNVRFWWVWELEAFLSLGEAAITHFMIRLLLEYEKVSCGCNQDLVLYLVVFVVEQDLRFPALDPFC